MTHTTRLLVAASCLVTVPAAPVAQSAPARAAIEQKLDVEKARVYVATLQPRVPTPSPNGHATHRVLVHLDDGTMTFKGATGAPETLRFKRGDVRWRAASGAYVAENTGDRPIRILEIDLKGAPSGPLPATKLDPPLVDPKHYTIDFENEHVRVMRVHFDPHDKGAQHEHILNRVVVYMNDQGQMKADGVRMAGAAVHAEQNETDTPQDRIAIELK
ncbi:MAG: hypothetical protein AB7H96_20190 [Vicinamibacterales bacterium]